MRVSKEFKVGLLVVVGLLLLFIGTNFLKGDSIFGDSREFYAVFTNAEGLKSSNDVMLNGVKIGQVKSVELHPVDPQKILVSFNVINKELQIPDNSEAWLVSEDLLGTKALDIRLNKDDLSSTFYLEGDTVISEAEMTLEEQINKQILPLKRKTEELIGSVESIIESVRIFWDTSAAYTIDESLYEVRDAIGRFATLADHLSVLVEQETESIGNILESVNGIATNLEGKSDQINSVIDNIADISDTLAASDIRLAISAATNTLNNLSDVLDKVSQGEGTLGALIHSDSLYHELVQTNGAIQSLLLDLQTNPNRYVHFSLFGRKNKGITITTTEERKLRQILDTIPNNP